GSASPAVGLIGPGLKSRGVEQSTSAQPCKLRGHPFRDSRLLDSSTGSRTTALNQPCAPQSRNHRTAFEFPLSSSICVPLSVAKTSSLDFIRLRGVRQNNLKGFDLDLPLGKYVVVTGLSGAGKSSLVFDTLHAEGQRRYVETFSAYTRQFLDLLNKPAVDSIENIRPSIAIEQSNTVKTSRSTVGTMTELTDFFKVWFSHVAECYDPETGEKVEDDNPQSIWAKASAAHANRSVIVAFKVAKPDNLTWAEILQNLKGQSYVRVLVPGSAGGSPATTSVHRIDDLLANPLPPSLVTHLYVAQDRLALAPAQKSRFLEAIETAL